MHSSCSRAGDGQKADVLMNSAVAAGASLDDFEHNLIDASANGWVMIAGEWQA